MDEYSPSTISPLITWDRKSLLAEAERRDLNPVQLERIKVQEALWNALGDSDTGISSIFSQPDRAESAMRERGGQLFSDTIYDFMANTLQANLVNPPPKIYQQYFEDSHYSRYSGDLDFEYTGQCNKDDFTENILLPVTETLAAHNVLVTNASVQEKDYIMIRHLETHIQGTVYPEAATIDIDIVAYPDPLLYDDVDIYRTELLRPIIWQATEGLDPEWVKLSKVIDPFMIDVLAERSEIDLDKARQNLERENINGVNTERIEYVQDALDGVVRVQHIIESPLALCEALLYTNELNNNFEIIDTFRNVSEEDAQASLDKKYSPRLQEAVKRHLALKQNDINLADDISASDIVREAVAFVETRSDQLIACTREGTIGEPPLNRAAVWQALQDAKRTVHQHYYPSAKNLVNHAAMRVDDGVSLAKTLVSSNQSDNILHDFNQMLIKSEGVPDDFLPKILAVGALNRDQSHTMDITEVTTWKMIENSDLNLSDEQRESLESIIQAYRFAHINELSPEEMKALENSINDPSLAPASLLDTRFANHYQEIEDRGFTK